MKLTKLLTFVFAGFVALSVVVLTIRQVMIKDVAQPYLAIVNAKVMGAEQNPVASALMLKDDRILILGDRETVLSALPEGAAVLDMKGKVIVPGKVSPVGELSPSLLSQGITTAQINATSVDDAEQYYWGRQHGWYDVRVQLVNDVALSDEMSDHLFFVGANHPNSGYVGVITEGGFADFQVLSEGQLEQTWLGGVKRFQVQ